MRSVGVSLVILAAICYALKKIGPPLLIYSFGPYWPVWVLLGISHFISSLSKQQAWPLLLL